MTRGPLALPLAALLGAAAWLGCGAPAGEPADARATPPPGRAVFLAEACPTCHGGDRMGTNVGPPIAGLHGRWTREELGRFLRAPAAFKQADPRLRRISERYRTDMPAMFSADEGRVRDLVRYLLEE